MSSEVLILALAIAALCVYSIFDCHRLDAAIRRIEALEGRHPPADDADAYGA